MKKGLTLILCLLVAALFVAPVFAQETTAGMQGIVKDATGAVVSGATVEVTSPAMLGVKKVETDASGYYRFANLPLGTYTISVTKQGFKSVKQSNISLAAGSLPSIELKLEVGGVEQVVEVSSAAPIVDVATSKVQTNLSEDVLAAVPKGRSFQSVIQFAPGARNEPLQGGYQIDGASNSENAYLVEGQETASVLDGHSASNVPMEFIQEVQVKSSGFEAEFGGALGGVVNVVQKRGGNAWHGSLFEYYQSDMFNAAPTRTFRYVPSAPTLGGHSASATMKDANGNTIPNPDYCGNFNTCRMDAPTQYYQAKKDHSKTNTPGFEIGGYLKKDRLWLFTSFAPEMFTLARTVKFNVPAGKVNQSPFVGPRTFNESINTYYTLGRLDYLLTQKIRLYGSMQYGYSRATGNSLPTADDAYNLLNLVSTTHPDNFNGGIGTVTPNSIYNFGADITLTPNIVATSRYGYFFQNTGSRGLGVGTRYYYRNTNYSYSTATADASAAVAGGAAGSNVKSLNGAALSTAFPAGVAGSGWFNLPVNDTTFFDSFKRFSYNQDLAWFKKSSFGTHNLKFGYALNKGLNDVHRNYNTSQVYVTYGANGVYYPNVDGGLTNCANIVAQNTLWFGAKGGANDGSSCQGNWGTVNLRDVSTDGKVGGLNHALYAQDAWTLGKGITLNVGIRMDKESLPSYFAGFKGIDFGFADKIAPRLGGSWDVFGNGKLKVYGSFGYFFDIMKYNLPRGSFGGDYWHDCVYALDTPDYTLINPTKDAKGHYCPTGGQVGAVGTLPPTTTAVLNNGVYTVTPGVRFIENYDYREPSNNPDAPDSLGATGYVDPKLKPMKQHEMVVGADWAISPAMAFETRYSRKRLDRTIEDAGVITANGESYYIVNPGMGVNSFNCTGCPKNPTAVRNYDGVEFRLTRRPVGKWFGSVAYTFSKLYGNYSGLTATDVSDGGGARNGANVDRAFDEPFMQFDSHGKRSDGPLATDRPHTLKAYGYYKIKWFGHETLLGGFQQWYSGTPLSTYVSIHGAPVFVEGRGKFVDMTRAASGAWVSNGISSRRTPQYIQTDLSVVQDFHISKSNEKLVLGFEGNVANVFNQHAATFFGQNLIRTGSLKPYTASDFAHLLTGYDYLSIANSTTSMSSNILNTQYGVPYGFQEGRTMRFKVKFAF